MLMIQVGIDFNVQLFDGDLHIIFYMSYMLAILSFCVDEEGRL